MSTQLPIPPVDTLLRTFGMLYLGYVLSMIGYGFTFYQTYAYFSQYPSDHWLLKGLVAILFALDTGSSVLVSYSEYFYAVTLLPYFGGLSEVIPNFTGHLLLSMITVFIVDLCFSFRIWESGKNGLVSGAISLVAIAAFSSGLVMAVMMYVHPLACFSIRMQTSIPSFKDPVFPHFPLAHIRVPSCLYYTLTSLGAFSTFFAFTRIPQAAPTPRPSTSSGQRLSTIPWHLMPYGLVGGGAHLLCLVMLASLPRAIFWIPFFQVATKLSINGLLNMLNMRPTSHGNGTTNDEQLATGRGSRSQRSTINRMFRVAPPEPFDTDTIEFSRTVEHGGTVDRNWDSRTKVYSSDHGDISFQNVTTGSQGALSQTK
ncbi:hypothetical protein B0H10DRAFT_1212699 [Mycena sp. CBHHK59/15]|nr:hypothetical protein B0H10DRAFT_1212699 [Mycena sp. CBHHK59/15]